MMVLNVGNDDGREYGSSRRVVDKDFKLGSKRDYILFYQTTVASASRE